MPESAPILVERPRDGVLRITINDPQRRNPLSTSVFRAIEAEVRAVERLSDEAHNSADVREGLSAFFKRRKPDFQGR
jgi:enoyl-CoA hydratase/carnithine racemase